MCSTFPRSNSISVQPRLRVSEPAQLSPGRPSDLLPASLFNNDELFPAVFQPALCAGVVQTRSHSCIPCSILSAHRSPAERAYSSVFSRVNILIPARSHSRQTHTTLGLPLPSPSIAAPCAHKAIRKYYWNLIRILHRAIAQSGISKIPHRGKAAIAHIGETTRRCRPSRGPTRLPAAKALGSSRVAHVCETTRRSHPFFLFPMNYSLFPLSPSYFPIPPRCIILARQENNE